MLKSSKELLQTDHSQFTMESLINNEQTLEGWLSRRKDQRTKNHARDKVNAILKQKRRITSDRELSKLLVSMETEVVEALTDLDVGIDRRILDLTLKAVQSDVLNMVKYKKRSSKDLFTLMRHSAYIHGNLDTAFGFMPLPLGVESSEVGTILYQSKDLILYVDVDYGGEYVIVPDALWWFDRKGVESGDRRKVVDYVKTGLHEHLKHVYRKYDEESIWVNDRGDFEFDFDNIVGFMRPDDAVFDYDKVSVQYDDGGSTYNWVVEEKGQVVVITWDSGDSWEIWVD